MLSNSPRYIQHVMDIGASVFVRGRTHGAENDFRLVQALCDICCEMQPSGLDIPLYHGFQSRLIDG